MSTKVVVGRRGGVFTAQEEEVTPEELVDQGSTWEFYPGTGDTLLGRRVAEDGTVLEEGVAVPPGSETAIQAQLDAAADQPTRDRAAAAVLQAATALAGTPAGTNVLTLLVGLGVLPVRAAKAAGWVPPS